MKKALVVLVVLGIAGMAGWQIWVRVTAAGRPWSTGPGLR
jgi:predicted negative regulator of RcsB-dependent stress response